MFFRVRAIAGLAIILFSLQTYAAIFGHDDRVAVTIGSRYEALARSTAIAVLTINLQPNPKGGFDLNADRLGDMLCKDERFLDDPSTSYSCSAFLVAPDLMVTAGHCFVNTGESHHETDKYCAIYSFVFDYQSDDTGHTKITGIAPDRIYHCKETIYAINGNTLTQNDFALIRLDRPVLDRKPLPLNTDDLAVGQRLSMIGYPVGSPAKFTGPAPILQNVREHTSVLTRLNAFEGNSGSAVFNDVGEVVGILVSGRPNAPFVTDPKNKCERINRCDADGANCLEYGADDSSGPGLGSDVQHIAPVAELLEQLSLVASSASF